MLKRLAIVAAIGAFLFGSPCVPQEAQPQTSAHKSGSQNQAQDGKRELPPSEVGKTHPSSENSSDYKTDDQKANGKPIPLPWYKFPEWIAIDITAASVVIAFFTLVFLAIQVWLMRITARRQLRAYVVTESGFILNVADPPSTIGHRPQTNARLIRPSQGPFGHIQIKNTGQTPAYDVLHWGGISVHEYPLNSELPTRPKFDGRGSQIIMGPGIPSTKGFGLDTRLSDDEVQRLRGGSLAIYVYGEVVYKDVFKKRHITRYRLMLHAAGGEVGVNTDLTFAEGGNETEDSPKVKRQKKRPKPS